MNSALVFNELLRLEIKKKKNRKEKKTLASVAISHPSVVPDESVSYEFHTFLAFHPCPTCAVCWTGRLFGTVILESGKS